MHPVYRGIGLLDEDSFQKGNIETARHHFNTAKEKPALQ
jgi:hypothetical protein